MLEASILLLPAWENSFPEICHKCRYGSNTGRTDFESPMAPAEVAQILVFLAMIVAQLPIGFNYAGLEVPFDPQEFTSRCVSEVDRLIVHDDHFAATLPGIECQIILSKYLLNEGRPRKAWLANRRAIDFARLAGMHLSTAKPPRPGDILFNRRLRIWCQLVGNDRFISLILGLPHAVPDSSYVPQVEMYLRASESTLDKYMWQLGIIIGKIIDRNQAGGEPCLPSTLRLEQDLEDIAKQTPEHWWDPDAQCGGMDERYQERYYERIILQFIHNLLRGMLHMPFITKSDRKFQYCHAAAAESAQNCLRLYKILRLEVKPYLCKICDFFAFMMGMLLAVQLFSGESSHRDEEQLARDWETVNEIATILRQAGTESAGAVAAESATILGGFYNCYVNRNSPDHSWGRTCKITVPYFGTITVALGEKLFGNRTAKPQQSQGGPSIATKESAAQLSTPPFSNSEDPPSAEAHDVLNNSSEMATASYPTESWTQNNMPAIPTVDLDFNAFQGFLGGFGEEMWPNLDMDLALDQGWGVDWLGGSSMS